MLSALHVVHIILAAVGVFFVILSYARCSVHFDSSWVQPDICVLPSDAAVQTVQYGLVMSVLHVVHISSSSFVLSALHVVQIVFAVVGDFLVVLLRYCTVCTHVVQFILDSSWVQRDI